MITRITIVLAILVLLFFTFGRPAKAQLGNLDTCETYYRFAKAHLWVFDYTFPQEKINEFKLSYEYSPEKSGAYSQLYLACQERRRMIHEYGDSATH